MRLFVQKLIECLVQLKWNCKALQVVKLGQFTEVIGSKDSFNEALDWGGERLDDSVKAGVASASYLFNADGLAF